MVFVELKGAGGRFDDAGENPQQGTLAATVAAQHTEDLASLDREADLL